MPSQPCASASRAKAALRVGFATVQVQNSTGCPPRRCAQSTHRDVVTIHAAGSAHTRTSPRVTDNPRVAVRQRLVLDVVARYVMIGPAVHQFR